MSRTNVAPRVTPARANYSLESGQVALRQNGRRSPPLSVPTFENAEALCFAECFDAPREECELALAYVNPGPSGDGVLALERRAELMEQWAALPGSAEGEEAWP